MIETVRASLGEVEALRLEHDLALAARTNALAWEDEIRDRYLRRMWDISLYMKTLKQRFTQWFNRHHQRKGTLWEARFHSVLVQAGGEPLAAMAAYIDLNSVRASLVADPKEYRWCGYGAAMGGDARAQAGLHEIEWMRRGENWRLRTDAASREGESQDHPVGSSTEALQWGDVSTAEAGLKAYRVLLYGRGIERGVGEDGQPLRKGFTRREARNIVATGGCLNRVEYLRCRVRYFTDGAVFGSREFVEHVFHTQRERFGNKRKSGARPLRGLVKTEKLYALRDLRVGLIT